MRRFLAVTLLLAAPAAARADDITALYPDAATFAFGADIKAITTSPLGKKVIGTDKPFDATRKLLKVLLPEDIFPVTDKSIKPLEAVANRLERVVAVANIEGGQAQVVVFLEGDIDEDAYVKAAEDYAKAEGMTFRLDKLGERKLVLVGAGNTTIHGVRVSKSLFVVSSHRELLDEVLDKHAGKRKAKVQPSLIEWQKKVKSAETPIWMVSGEWDVLSDFKGGMITIGLKDNADFRIEVSCAKEQLADTIKSVFEGALRYFEQERSPQAKVWHAAGITVKQDGTTVTATGSIPGKLLIEEYAKQK